MLPASSHDTVLAVFVTFCLCSALIQGYGLFRFRSLRHLVVIQKRYLTYALLPIAETFVLIIIMKVSRSGSSRMRRSPVNAPLQFLLGLRIALRIATISMVTDRLAFCDRFHGFQSGSFRGGYRGLQVVDDGL